MRVHQAPCRDRFHDLVKNPTTLLSPVPFQDGLLSLVGLKEPERTCEMK